MAIRFDGRVSTAADLSRYTSITCCEGDRITVVQDPIRANRNCIRSVRRITDTAVLSGYRAELYTTAYKRTPPFTEWYEWEMLVRREEFAQGWPNPMIVFQVHDDWSGGGAPHLPPIMLGITENALNVLCHSSAVQNPALPSDISELTAVTDFPLVWGEWRRVVIRAKFATDNTGELDIWYGGERVCALRSINNAYPGNALFVQTGAYSGLDQLRAPVYQKSVYSTGLRIYDDSTTHAEMGVSDEIPMCSSGKFRQ